MGEKRLLRSVELSFNHDLIRDVSHLIAILQNEMQNCKFYLQSMEIIKLALGDISFYL